jgi:Peptidase family M50
LAIVSGVFIFTSGYLIFGYVRRIMVREVGFSLGPTIFSFRKRAIVWRFGLIPLTSWVKFAPDVENSADGYRGLEQLSIWEGILLRLSGIVILLIASMILIGPANATGSFLNGFVQFVRGVIDPKDYAKPQLASFVALVKQHEWRAVIGIVWSKMAMINTLPTPVCAGGMAVVEIIHCASGKAISRESINRVLLPLALIMLIGLLIWGFVGVEILLGR